MAARTSALADLHFPAIILDEAQAIKNAGSARSRAIRSLHGERRIALSGTPVENNLNELWSLMGFLNRWAAGQQKKLRILHPFPGTRLCPRCDAWCAPSSCAE